MPTPLSDFIQAKLSLLHHWKLNDASGSSSADTVGGFPPPEGALSGVYHGTPNYRQAGPGGTNTAINFPTTSEYWTSSGSIWPPQQEEVAWEVWFKLDSLPAPGVDGVVMSIQDVVVFSVNHAGDVTFAGKGSGFYPDFDQTIVVPAAVVVGQWCQVACLIQLSSSSDLTSYYCFVNGYNAGSMLAKTSTGRIGQAVMATATTYLGHTGASSISGLTYANLPGTYQDFATYTATGTSNPSTFALSTWNVGGASVAQNARVTQLAVESLRTGGAKARVTEVVAEVLRDGSPKARVTEIVVEVLRTSSIGIDIPISVTTGLEIGDPATHPSVTGPHIVFATTTMNLGLTATKVGTSRFFTRVATTGLAVEIQDFPLVTRTRSASATTGFSTRLNASYPLLAAATTHLDVGHGATGRKGVSKAATTGLSLAHTGPSYKYARGLATTGLTMLPNARNPENPNVFVVATTQVAASLAPDVLVNRVWYQNAETRAQLGLNPQATRLLLRGATTGLLLVHDAAGHNTTQFASASTQLVSRLTSSGTVPAIRLVSARSGFVLSRADSTLTTAIVASATTGLKFKTAIAAPSLLRTYQVIATTGATIASDGHSGSSIAWHVAGSTTVDVAIDADVGVNRTYRPRASSGFILGLSAGQRATRVYRPSAATSLAILSRAASTLLRSYAVQAQAGLTFGSLGTAVKVARAAGTTGLAVGVVPTPVGRIFHVSAVTAMSVARGEDNNFFFHSAGSTRFELRLVGTARKTGTPADAGIELTHLAEAEVWLAWRRSILDLSPGGQLPH